ncbi:VWFA domain-containing protein [Entamoeba marina]
MLKFGASKAQFKKKPRTNPPPPPPQVLPQPFAPPVPQRMAYPAAPPVPGVGGKGGKGGKGDVDDNQTNVMSIELSFLQNDVAMRVGEPFFCQYCKASLSHLDKIENNKFKCHFCGTENQVPDLLPEELPDSPVLDYVTQAPEATTEKKAVGTLVYCIDTSGSMCINVDTKGPKMQTRLDAVKSAIGQQIRALKETNPEQKVCLVQFSREVKIHGDCTKNPIEIKGNALSDYDTLVDIAQEKVNLVDINHSFHAIQKRIQDMEEQGSTALGPALLISTIIAGKEPGSQVILCTDGTANFGLGNIEDSKEEAIQFYNTLTTLAKSKGVIININTIKGCDANLRVLGDASAETNGEVSVVDPNQLDDAFGLALDKVIIATDVSISIFLHPAIYIDEFSTSEHPSRRKILFGNVFDDSIYQFKYALRPDEDIKQYGEIKSFPTQIQIEYERVNGMKGIRVITNDVNVAEEDEEVHLDGEVLQTFYIQQTAKQAKAGNITSARQQMNNYRNISSMAPIMQQSAYDAYADELDEVMPSKDRGRYDSDSDDDFDAPTFGSSKPAAKKERRRRDSQEAIYMQGNNWNASKSKKKRFF